MIFQGFPDPDEVLDALGDKVVDGMRESHALARRDMQLLRIEHPDWFAEYSQRHLGSLVHEHIWMHAKVIFDEMPDMVIVDKEPYHDLYVGTNFQIRFKRHHLDRYASAYPTQATLDLYLQEPTLEGLELVFLLFGDLWNREQREMGAPVLSLPREHGACYWQQPLDPFQLSTGSIGMIPSGDGGPKTPGIDVPSLDEQAEEDEE